MDDRSTFQREPAPDQRYPDPSATPTTYQGVFYNQADNEDPGAEEAAELTRQLEGAASIPDTRDQYGLAQNNQNGSRQQDSARRTSTPGHPIAQDFVAPRQQDGRDNGDVSAQKKARSKVSRACDECRRKKIRCDASDIDDGKACSSCDRTGMRCQYSRQPMKRGPSKGYIKELADRLNSLESQMVPQQQQQPQQQYQPHRMMGQDFTQSGSAYRDFEQQLGDPSSSTRKRTHSMSVGSGVEEHRDGPYAASRPSEQRRSPPRVRHSAFEDRSAHMQPALQPRPAGVEALIARPAQESHNGNGWSYGTVEEGRSREPPQPPLAAQFGGSETPVSFEWDESVIDEYVHSQRDSFLS
jgi:hypothetical protein